MARSSSKRIRGTAALNAFVLPFEDEEKAPSELRLFRKGVNETEKGDFLFDEEAAKTVMAFFNNKGLDLSFDFEHQALEQPAVIAPAAGWFRLEVRNEELWAVNIRWTARAQAMIEAREYRFFSPAFEFDRESGRVTRLINTALTNNPAMDRIDALIAASSTNGADMATEDEDRKEELKALRAELASLKATNDEQDKELKALRAKLQEDEDEDDEKEKEEDNEAMSVALSIGKRSSKSERLVTAGNLVRLRSTLREATGKDSDAGALGVIAAWKADASDVATLKAKAESEDTDRLTEKLKGVLDKASEDGKIPPANREHFEAMALRVSGGKKLSGEGLEFMEAHVATMGVANSDKATGDKKHVKVSASQNGMLAAMGINQKAFAEDKAEQAS